MIECTARVAPEEAVFRPALPLHFLQPEFTGERMTKLTYAEQIKHPNWQRKRLEMLEGAGWQCQECGERETTLHVHHRRYVKGRMAWEYDVSELAVLCEDCHKQEHGDQDVLNELLASTRTNTNAALIAGFHRISDWIESGLKESARQGDAYGYAAGFVAYITYELGDIDKVLKVAQFAASLHGEMNEARLAFECSRGNTFGEDAAA